MYMHKEVIHFITNIVNYFSIYFNNVIVLDVGAGDINGNNKKYFNNCVYFGNDVCLSENVNIVSRTKDLNFYDEYFDTIISTECFEHDPEYEKSFKKIYKLLKPNGLFVFTCASTGRPEHGTRNSKPYQSYGTIMEIEDMQDYYKNLNETDINDILCLKNIFIFYKFYYNNFSKDLYFVGIKKGFNDLHIINKYSNFEYTQDNVIETTNNINITPLF